MQWICGWNGQPASRATSTQPLGGQPFLRLHGTAWSIGYSSDELHTEQAPALHLSYTVIGNCLAGPDELSDGLDDAKAGRWSRLAMWPGSYMTVVSQPDKAVVFGDLAGRHLVHYVQTMHGVWWSSAATPLAALTGDRVDPARLVCNLAAEGMPPYGGDTPFHSIRTVPPGHYLEVNEGRVVIGAWYQPLDLTYETTAERLKVLLEDAVDRRYPMTADLSGGLDSSSLVCVAARHQDPIDVLTQRDTHRTDGDETYAQAVLDVNPHVRQHVLHSGDSDLHYAGLSNDLPPTDLPSLDVNAVVPVRSQIEWAQDRGS